MPTVGQLDSLRVRLASRFEPAEPLAGIAELATRYDRPLSVAIVRSDGIGDWIMSLGIVDGLLASPAVGRLTIVAPGGYRSLLGHRDGVAFEPFEAPTIIAPPSPGGTIGKALALSRFGQRRAIRAGAARHGRFDLAVLPRWDTDAGFNARAWALGAGAVLAGHDPSLVPGAGPREREERALIAIRTSDDRAAAHDTAHAASLAEALGVPVVAPAGAGLRQFGVERGSRSRPLVLVHAGSNEPRRRWPVERWRDVIVELAATGAEIVLVGGPEDVEVYTRITAGLGVDVRSVAGQMPLGELPELAAQATLLVGNDSGPAHVACSVGTPVVVISNHPVDGDPAYRTSPSRFGPWVEASRLLRPAYPIQPCVGFCSAPEAHCIAAVRADEVVAASIELLAGTAGDAS